ncbi:MAG: GGDEF domain-containing protein [Solirubrobacterales bacterium]
MTTKNAFERRRGATPWRLVSRVRRLPPPVWAMAMIYGVGGAMCIFAATFPISPTAPVTLARFFGVGLLIGSFLLLRFGASLPEGGLQAAAFAGTIVNSVLVSACTTDYGAALNSFAYLWVGIYAGQFFGQRAVRLQCLAIVIASGAAFLLSGLPGMVTAWVLVAGSSVLASETLARLNSRLRRQLITDPLTGLLNRAGFVAAAERIFALADRGGMPVCVALIDLDGFKQVNDQQGHAAGDELLIELGEAWGDQLRGSEVLARLGGDEFALVLAGAGHDGAADALGRLRGASPVDWSVGLVEWRRGESLDQAMAEADEELYRAKREGRAGREAAKVAACEPPLVLRSSSLPSA